MYVTSDVPACYMYVYSNTTKATLDKQVSQLESQIIMDKTTMGMSSAVFYFLGIYECYKVITFGVYRFLV